MPIAYFLIAIAFLVVAVTAVRPPLTDRPAWVRPGWLLAMLGGELVFLWFGGLVVITAVALAASVAASAIGRFGLTLAGVALAIDLVLIWRSSLARRAMRTAVADVVDVTSWPIDIPRALVPNPYRVPKGIDLVSDVEYDEGLQLDLYRSSHRTTAAAPALIHVHGGGWHGGNRRQQGRPLIHAMASAGWVVASVDYPLTPAATFPDPIVGLHRALGWLRSHADDLGIDRRQIYVVGESAGGHLAALLALTDGRSEWSTTADDEPRIAGAVTLYGVYDLLDTEGVRDPWPIVAEELIKADKISDPDKFTAGSPIAYVSPDAPAFVVIHGTHDALVPIAESRRFVETLRAISRQAVMFAEIPGATHSFDVVPSLRTQLVVTGIAAFLQTHAATLAGDRSV